MTDSDIQSLQSENQRLRDQLDRFSALSSRIAENLASEVVLQRVVDAACELTSARYGALAVFDDEGHVQEFIVHGINEEERDAVGDLPKGLGLLGYLHKIQTPMRLTDLTQHQESVGFPANHPKMNSFMGIPLRRGDEKLGNLYLTEKEGGEEFTAADLHVLEIFANHAALAIHNSQRFEIEQHAHAQVQEARQLLQSIMDNSPAVISVKDTHGCYISINRRYEELFKVDRDEVRGKTDHDLHSQEVAAAIRTNDQLVLQAGGPLEFEETMPSKDGSLHTYLAVKFPLWDAHGKVYAVCAIATDITTRIEVEQLKADFLSMISHDLRGPLTSIKGLSSLLLMDSVEYDTETTMEYLNSIDEETDRMSELVSNLLDMSRIEASAMPLDPEVCHLADIASEVVRITERSRIGGDHTIIVDVPLDLPEIYADYDQVGRVLSNLLSNSIKYSPANSEIVISARVKPDSPNVIVTTVKDHGVGIPEADRDQIFDKFYRVSTDLGRGRPGSGLGLAICKAIVEAHNGNLWVDSAVGRGSTFFFTLPI
ncbi:MAG: PAS domain-containing protein [Chloroflexi bacterium]|nr:PAS domain-containing protein [Chloroflexota bacterium]